MFYIVGLGNPGEQYIDTPHNVGWAMTRELYKKNMIDFSSFAMDGFRNARVSGGTLEGQLVELIEPQTFMNESGKSLKHINPDEIENVIVIYDDIDLPFGTVKIARNRGSGGHNGLKSIEQHLKTKNFIRLRVGVAPTDWFGNIRKPKGHNAVQNYLVKRKWSTRYSKRYSELGGLCDTYIKRIIAHGYKNAVSRQQ